MRILIIDSHKGTKNGVPQNMHWQNSKILADYLGADFIWSYPSVNDEIKSGYDIIIFVHASHYAYTDYKWVEQSPDARLFYITNEYNLGEPRTLWMAAKEGRKYDVIANHPHEASKVVMKYVNEWHNLNINALIYSPRDAAEYDFQDEIRIGSQMALFDYEHRAKFNCIYYGSFRKDRSLYFKKYLDENVLLSTHPKNIDKFRGAGATSGVCGRIDWQNGGLFPYKQSLYIEDEKTHVYYNYLANRFYEALNYGCTPIFSEECRRTVELSGYSVPDEYFISSPFELKQKEYLTCLDKWHWLAEKEKTEALVKISRIITTQFRQNGNAQLDQLDNRFDSCRLHKL